MNNLFGRLSINTGIDYFKKENIKQPTTKVLLANGASRKFNQLQITTVLYPGLTEF